MVDLLGRWIARRSWILVFVWMAVLAAGVCWVMFTEPLPPSDLGSFLPEGSPQNKAVDILRQAFPELAARSSTIVVAHRGAGLTSEDFTWLGSLAIEIGKATGGVVLSPAMPFFNLRLVSEDRQVAMVVANLKTGFISDASAVEVRKIETLAASGCPAGLQLEFTGVAAIGRDYAAATRKAMHHTTLVTITAVLVILVVVYRSPVGAFVPLASIGTSVFLAFVLLSLLVRGGWQVTDIERLFAVVLLFGAGVDYALFWIAGYRELVVETPDLNAAAVEATRCTSPAIIASAATTICGLSMMIASDLIPTKNVGKVLAPVLVVALLAALTLSPAVARLLGRALFWPVGMKAPPSLGQRTVWPILAGYVGRAPAAILVLGVVVLGLPALKAPWIELRYDSLSELPLGSSSERGFRLLEKHFAPGQLFPTQVVLEFERALPEGNALGKTCRELSDRIMRLPGVEDVYSLDAPLGSRGWGRQVAVVDGLIKRAAKPYYQSPKNPALRFEVLIKHRPFSREAMALIGEVQAIALAYGHELGAAGSAAAATLSGLTPYIIDVRTISGADQVRVMCLATIVIGLIVVAVVRDLPLTLFMIFATWLTYGATLTICDACFVHLFGESGLDWKVCMIVFVIVVAVGQDYNIFLVSRLQREARRAEVREATARAIVNTGSVISNCGLIMAATLGSLAVGGLSLLRQIGLALAVGILIDTFFVRPVLIPSFFLVWRRRAVTRREVAGPG
ncbi:MAG TPA: MMPL family transporter [Phycisphaerae bacterium]|nr:MMPL family transporter [Phycisphaerae bacterium]HRY67478.1 MMPL family transporter [Phycisphaerae bacterium]HSA27929.1 MMPL family transporter [Phycisphaerae bacterium]